jgi:sterol desaturase/sphingolipid hydroxylase (fatty acid hydroxylase superfamily)
LIKLPFVNVGVESILICFFYGGIASSLYKTIFNGRLRKLSTFSKEKGIEKVLLSFAFWVFVFIILWRILGINVIYASAIGFVAMGGLLTYFRPDLLIPNVLSAILMASISLLILILFEKLFKGIFDAWWLIDSLSGIRIFQVPVEEVLWHLAFGWAISPVYEVLLGYKDYRIL